MFLIPHKVILTSKSVNVTLVCDHSNESHGAVFSCGTVFVLSVDETLVCDHLNEFY